MSFGPNSVGGTHSLTRPIKERGFWVLDCALYSYHHHLYTWTASMPDTGNVPQNCLRKGPNDPR